MSPAIVPLNDRDQLLANVSTVRVGYEEVEHVVRAFGTLEIADPNKTVISARFNGRIEKLYVSSVGVKVKKVILCLISIVRILSRQKTNTFRHSGLVLSDRIISRLQNQNWYYWD